MGSALERHAAGQGALAVRETARELAAASVSANTRRASGTGSPGARSTTPPSPNTWPTASRRAIPRPRPDRSSLLSGSTRCSATGRPRSGPPPNECWPGSGAKDGPGAGGRWWVSVTVRHDQRLVLLQPQRLQALRRRPAHLLPFRRLIPSPAQRVVVHRLLQLPTAGRGGLSDGPGGPAPP